MSKNELKRVLDSWNFWEKDLPAGIPRRRYLPKLRSYINTNHVVTITGPRRAGKSYLMRQAALDLIAGGVPRSNILFVNLEDPRFTVLDTKLLEQIVEAYREKLLPHGKIHIFLDEIQEVERWEKWVRMMHELQKAKLVVSGSNAKLLGRELATLLTGRHLDITVFPLSFREFLAFNGIDIEANLLAENKRVTIQGLLHKYLEFGSFPEVVLLPEDKSDLLLSYFDDLVNKDLVRRFKIRKQAELKSLLKFYMSNIASLSTFKSIENSLHISANTVEKFTGYLEEVYVVFSLKRFSFKVREQEKSPRKIYSIDTGLSNAVGFRFSENIGRLAENAVFIELKRRQMFTPDLELFYWKDIHHREVDFVLKEGTKVTQLIQVCWSVADPKTKERETRSLAKAIDELKAKDALVITEEYEGEEEVKGHSIRFMPLWKWLLSDVA